MLLPVPISLAFSLLSCLLRPISQLYLLCSDLSIHRLLIQLLLHEDPLGFFLVLHLVPLAVGPP